MAIGRNRILTSILLSRVRYAVQSRVLGQVQQQINAVRYNNNEATSSLCVLCSRDGANNKKCIRMLRCIRKPCPHAAPHRIQTQLSSRCTAPHRKLNILSISTNIRKKLAL